MSNDDIDYTKVPVFKSGKRCGVQWTPWMGDWFTSWSPRNGNSHAEGPWDHWVDLALNILRDDLTRVVYPEAHAAVKNITPRDFYSDTNVTLTDAELDTRLRREKS